MAYSHSAGLVALLGRHSSRVDDQPNVFILGDKRLFLLSLLVLDMVGQERLDGLFRLILGKVLGQLGGDLGGRSGRGGLYDRCGHRDVGHIFDLMTGVIVMEGNVEAYRCSDKTASRLDFDPTYLD